MNKDIHIPVLSEKVIELLRPKRGDKFADVTAGYGGHSALLLDAIGSSGQGYLFDKDPASIESLRQKFASDSNITISHTDFGDIDWDKDTEQVDMILADIGVSSPQIDLPERGFSFSSPGPLDMRMNTEQTLTAADIVNTYTEQELANIIYQLGEERASRKIAAAVVRARAEKTFETTAELADLIDRVVGKHGKIHPATKTFQALRIAVNDELGALEKFLNTAPEHLTPGGRLAVISFHSLEDRLVKQAFKQLTTLELDEYGHAVSEPMYTIVTKKPIQGSEHDNHNPRARSAKLRVLEKIKKNKGE